MKLDIIILNEVSQKKRQISYYITYMWNLKYDKPLARLTEKKTQISKIRNQRGDILLILQKFKGYKGF